jgi:DNA polymerase-1
MRLILDVENTVVKRNDKLHLDPFESENSLVMVGMKTDNWERIVTFDHNDVEPTPNGHQIVQDALNNTTVLVCHNVAHDLIWLWESGFEYDGIVFDTMLGEYVLQRGQKKPLSLEQCAERYNLDNKKQDTMKEYFKSGKSVSEIPHSELSEYLTYDLRATFDLANRIHNRLMTTDADLMDTVTHTNMVAVCLCKVYRTGFKVDLTKLEEVKKEFEQEKMEITKELIQQVRDLMGDRLINLNSPEQLSWIIYSRKPKDKALWGNFFDPYMSKPDFQRAIKDHSDVVYKVTAKTCHTCKGRGKITKVKKDGTPFKKPNKCPTCNESGWLYQTRPDQIAGLRFNPPSAKWVSANGFSTNKINLEILEFRTAAYLSQDATAIKEIEDGFDVHSYTAQVITDAGQPTSRQEAKAHTFAPLYGATGFGRSQAEASYYEQFSSKYKGVAKWHRTLANEALQTGRIRIPSGRSFAFPDVVRRSNGSVSHFTQIKNYPVQAFATADIVPLVLMTIDNMLLNMESCIVNTVHDSIVIDVHPDEVDQVLNLVNSINSEMKKLINTRWKIDFNVPLKLDAKIGDNWLDTKDVV